MTERELRAKVVDTAKAWLGCKESNGTHKKIIDTYNAHKPLARGYAVKYTDAWCATFASAVAIKAGLTDIIPLECGCGKYIELAKKAGIWVENDAFIPQAGDYILYDWQDSGAGDNTGAADHIGIVVSVSGNTIKVIEGNKNDAVEYRDIAVNGRYIRGFVTPKYASKATTKEEPKQEPKKTVAQVAQEVIDGKWGNGDARKKKLSEAGYNPSEVQAKVNELLKKPAAKTYSVGDTVIYTGTKHYTNASKSAVGKTCKGGKAKITQISKGAAHPYHLVAVKGSGATVYGWVDAGSFN